MKAAIFEAFMWFENSRLLQMTPTPFGVGAPISAKRSVGVTNQKKKTVWLKKKRSLERVLREQERDMERKIILVLVSFVLAVASTFNPGVAQAQNISGCKHFEVEYDADGRVIKRTCLETSRDLALYPGIKAGEDRDRSGSSMVSPGKASSHVSTAYRWGTTNGDGGLQQVPPRPYDRRTEREIAASLVEGIRVTGFEAQAHQAAREGIAYGQHVQVMTAIGGLQGELDAINRRLGSLAASDTALRAQLEADRGRLERELRQAKATSRQTTVPQPIKPPLATGGGGSTSKAPKLKKTLSVLGGTFTRKK